jgi:xanthine dehydrogenase large subunit
LLTPQEAKRQQSYVLPPMHLARGAPAAAQERGRRGVLSGEFYVGGQEQFYLEGQISYAAPKEDGCMHVLVLDAASDRDAARGRQCARPRGEPGERGDAAHGRRLRRQGIAIGDLRLHRRDRGAAACSGRSSCAWIADDDFMITGKRHCCHYAYDIGFDDDGRIAGARIEMAFRAGFSADLSGPVATRAVCHFDNAYYLPDVDIVALCGKTNTQSNTAFRGFGGPQGAIAIEYLIDNIAREIDRDPLDVRWLNFYGTESRNVTPYGQVVEDSVIHELVAELETSSDYRARRAATRAFNSDSRCSERGSRSRR